MSHNTQNINICIVAGEASGDAQASLLLKSLKEQLPNNVLFWGIGGPCLKEHGFDAIEDINQLAVMGASEVLVQYLNISTISFRRTPHKFKEISMIFEIKFFHSHYPLLRR